MLRSKSVLHLQEYFLNDDYVSFVDGLMLTKIIGLQIFLRYFVNKYKYKETYYRTSFTFEICARLNYSDVLAMGLDLPSLQ